MTNLLRTINELKMSRHGSIRMSSLLVQQEFKPSSSSSPKKENQRGKSADRCAETKPIRINRWMDRQTKTNRAAIGAALLFCRPGFRSIPIWVPGRNKGDQEPKKKSTPSVGRVWLLDRQDRGCFVAKTGGQTDRSIDGLIDHSIINHRLGLDGWLNHTSLSLSLFSLPDRAGGEGCERDPRPQIQWIYGSKSGTRPRSRIHGHG